MTIELEDLKVWCYYTNIELDVAIRNMLEGMTIELEDLKVWCYYTNIELDVAIRNMKKGGYDHRVGRS